MELISLTLVLLFAIPQPLQTYLIMPVHVKVRYPLFPVLTAVPKCVKPLGLNQPISS